MATVSLSWKKQQVVSSNVIVGAIAVSNNMAIFKQIVVYVFFPLYYCTIDNAENGDHVSNHRYSTYQVQYQNHLAFALHSLQAPQ